MHGYPPTKDPGDRRPIAARDWKVFQRLADWLSGTGISPNAVSVAGMVFGVLAGAAFALTSSALPASDRLKDVLRIIGFLAGALCVQLRLLANMLDGMVAVSSGRVSAVGELYNEVPDRVSDSATLIGAGYAWGGDPALGYLAACLAIFTAYVRALGKAAGTSQEFCGPMAKQQRMFIITVTAILSAALPLEWPSLWGNQSSWSWMAASLMIICLGAMITAVRRLVRISARLRKGS